MNKQNKQQRQNTARKQARADLWDMVNAFVTTPDLQSLQFENDAGAIVMTKAEREQKPKRIGFNTYAVAHSTLESDGIYDNYCNANARTTRTATTVTTSLSRIS